MKQIFNIENGKIVLNIIRNMLQIKIQYNSQNYLSFFCLNSLKKMSKYFSYLSLIGIKDFITQRINEKSYSIVNNSSHLKFILSLDLDNNAKIELLIPLDEQIKDVTAENIIRLETEILNLNNTIKGIKEEVKNEIKEELKKEIIEEINEKEKIINNNIIVKINKEFENNKPILLFHQKYEYINSIIINQKILVEVPFYTRQFKTDKMYNFVQVNINIPYTSMDCTEYSHGKIITYLDDEVINDSTIHISKLWELKPLTIIGYVQNLKIGIHHIKIKACVDHGNLYLPHVNQDCIEYTINPKISGSITIIGF